MLEAHTLLANLGVKDSERSTTPWNVRDGGFRSTSGMDFVKLWTGCFGLIGKKHCPTRDRSVSIHKTRYFSHFLCQSFHPLHPFHRGHCKQLGCSEYSMAPFIIERLALSIGA